jgi:hypothetical protein
VLDAKEKKQTKICPDDEMENGSKSKAGMKRIDRETRFPG